MLMAETETKYLEVKLGNDILYVSLCYIKDLYNIYRCVLTNIRSRLKYV